jgi:hypothetical protein
MADGYASQFLPALSRLMGEVEQPTNTQGAMNPQFGGSPEQLMGILQHPQVQGLMSHLGIHFDPSQMRQSPFLPNRLMQGHPLLGGMLNSAMANVAATPEAPLVSGAGSGMTRAMQGMQGGPEMLRQYQVRQMLSPMQAMGSMIPGQEFQRKEQLMTLLEKMEQDRAAQAAKSEQFREGTDVNKIQGKIYSPPGVPGYFTMGQPHQAQINAPGMQGGMSNIMGPMLPGGPQYHPYDPEQERKFIEAQHPERAGQAGLAGARQAEQEQETEAGMPGAKVGAEGALAGQRTSAAELNRARVPTEGAKQDELKARGERERAQAAQPGGRYAAARQEQYAKQYNDAEKHAQDEIAKIQQLVASKAISKELGDQQIQMYQNWLATQKENVDRQMGKPGQSAREAGRAVPKTVAPGASAGTGQAGGAGSQKSEGTATPPIGAGGLPAGYVFNEQGIPVRAPQQ